MSAFIPQSERFALRFINGAYVILDRVRYENVAGPFRTIREARADAQAHRVSFVMKPALQEVERSYNALFSK